VRSAFVALACFTRSAPDNLFFLPKMPFAFSIATLAFTFMRCVASFCFAIFASSSFSSLFFARFGYEFGPDLIDAEFNNRLRIIKLYGADGV